MGGTKGSVVDVTGSVTLPEGPGEDKERVKVSMNFMRTDLDALKRWATRDGTTVTQLVQRALSVYQLLTKAQDEGATVVIRPAKGPEVHLAKLSPRLT